MECATPSVFHTCGVNIPLRGVDLPDYISIAHSINVGDKCFITHRDDVDNKFDVNLVLEGKILPAHKAILSARVPFFRGLLNSNMIECAKGEINLASDFCDFEPTTIESLVDYAYTGQLTISTANVQDLIMGANFLGIERVMDECAQFMRRRLRLDNVLQLFLLCRSISYAKIDSFLLSFIDANFVILSMTKEFLELSIDDVVAFLQRDSIHVDKEDQVFEVISRWIGCANERKTHAARLLACVRCIPTLLWSHTTQATDFISNTIEKTEWVMSNAECVKLVNEAKECLTNNNLQSNSFNTTERDCEDAHRLLLSFSKSADYPNNGPHTVYVHLYDPITNIWTECKSRKQQHRYQWARIVDYKIYFTFEQKAGAVFEIFDILTNEWHSEKEYIESNMPPFPIFNVYKNGYSESRVIKEKNYEVGGRDADHTILSTLQSYDPATKEWTVLSPMSKPRSEPASCALNGKLYVFGGLSNSREFLNDAECYDPETDKWTPLSPMKFERDSGVTAILKGQIYVIGGFDGDKVNNEVERYDATTDTWTTVASMRTGRFYHGLFVSCGKIFVYGGYDNLEGGKTTTCEMYDPDTDSWEARAQWIKDSVCIAFPVPATYPSPVPNLESIWISGFGVFHLQEDLMQAIFEYGFMTPTEAQSASLPAVLLGSDLVCQAKSGAGKTTMLIIGSLHLLKPVDGEVSVLVICSTRQQTATICEGYERFSKYLQEIKAAAFVGGVSIRKDADVVKNHRPHIAIGTPSRILNLIQAGALKLDKIKHLLLDECDRMICDRDMRNAIEKLCESCPKEKQTMITTFTFPEHLQKFRDNFMRPEPHRYDFVGR